MAGPLQGYTVVEMAAIGPAPFCAMMLADMGAEVIRIDRKPAAGGNVFDEMKRNATDRGRRSIALDMKQPAAAEVVLRLVDKADALIEGFRPGVMERLGLGPEVCRQRNRKLVYGRMTGWGQEGPLAQVAGHDLNFIALSGALQAMGRAGEPPSPPLHLVGDIGSGATLLAFGIVCAMLEAQRSGEGQVIDAAIADGAAYLSTMYYSLFAQQQWSNRREDNLLDGGAPFYGCYACADGRYISIGPIEAPFYRLLLQRCGISDPEFDAQWNKKQWPALRARLAALFVQRTQAQWCELLEGSDACFAPVLDWVEAPQHPYHRARGNFVEIDGVTQPAPAPRFSRTPGAAAPMPAHAGADGEALLRHAGYTEAEIAALRAGGTVA